MVRIIIVGFGTVGKALIKILHEQKDELVKIYKFTPQIVAISELKGALINNHGKVITKLN